MPRTSSMQDVDSEVTEKLESYSGSDIEFPANLKSLGVIRNAVYRHNRTNGRKFKILVTDYGVTITERKSVSPHKLAHKSVSALLKDAPEKVDPESLAAATARAVLDAFANVK